MTEALPCDQFDDDFLNKARVGGMTRQFCSDSVGKDLWNDASDCVEDVETAHEKAVARCGFAKAELREEF